MRILTVLSLAAVWLASSSAWARPEFVALQERAQGYSLTGGSLQNDSLYSNPASSAFTEVYAVEGVFAAPRSFGVSVLDTKTSAIGGALGYFRDSQIDGSKPLQGFKLALMGKATQWLGVGVSAKTVWGADSLGGNFRMNDGDAGVFVRLLPVTMGLSVRNVLGGRPADGFDREVSFGAQVNYDELVYFSASAVAPWGRFQPNQYGVGMEYVSPFLFSLKGGYRIRPQENLSYWSAGASLLSPKVHVHYTVEFPENNPNESIHHGVAAAMQL